MEEGFFLPDYEVGLRKIEEKRKLRQVAMFIGIAMLIMAAVSVFFASIYLNIMAAFGIDRYTASKIANDPMAMQLINQILSVLMFILPFFIILSGCSVKFDEVVSLSLPDKKSFLPTVLLGLAFCGFANLATNILMSLFSGFGFEIPDYSVKTPNGLLGVIVTIVGTAIIPPLTEEFALRGIVMGTLRKYGDKFAIVTSAILFGLMHGNLRQIPFAFVVGLILGYAVIKTGSLWTGIVIHFINNLCASVLSILGEYLPENISTIMNLSFFALCILCGFISVLFKQKEIQNRDTFSENETSLSNKEKASTFFTSPFIIAYIIVTAFEVFVSLL